MEIEIKAATSSFFILHSSTFFLHRHCVDALDCAAVHKKQKLRILIPEK